MEAGRYGLTRGTCFFARRLDVVAVAGLLRLSWCVLGGVEFFVLFFSTFFLAVAKIGYTRTTDGQNRVPPTTLVPGRHLIGQRPP